MGLLSGIIKGVSRLGAVMRDLPGKINRWDLSREIRKNTKPAQTVTEIPVVDDSWRRHKKRHVPAPAPVAPVDDSWRRHKKRHVSAGAPVNAELEALRKKTEELQRQIDMYRRTIEDGAMYGNVKASSDPDKLKRQQQIADAIDKKREEIGAMPGTAEYDEARAEVLEEEGINDYGDSDPPVFNPETDLTAEDREAYYALQEGTPI